MSEETVVWGRKVSADFKAHVLAMSKRLGTKADYLMAIMALETGRTFDPAQRNLKDPKNGPVGLIQFTQTGAASVGTTKDALAKMTALEQLAYVEKFLGHKKALGLSRLEDLYAAIHYPAAVGDGGSRVLYSRQEGKRGLFYRKNSGMDLNKDGNVTLEEATRKVRDLLIEGEKHRG